MMTEFPGADKVIQWFGQWPSFHDAEILELHLARAGRSWLKIHTWNMTDQVDESGHYRLEKHAVVTFTLEEVTGLQVDGFSSQNVIAGLEVERLAEGFRITLAPCYGLAGTLEAARVIVDVAPGKPA
jgi:hypothetical protein